MIVSINEQTFVQEVLTSDKPVIVHFWAPWCGLCRAIEPILATFQFRWEDEIQLVGLNADLSLRLASAYRLTTLPTLILFQSGNVIHRLEAFQGREGLYQHLEKMVVNLVPQSV